MATKYYLRNTASDLAGAGQKALSVAPGAASTTKVTNTATGPANIVVTDTAGGQALTWFTPKLDAVTISGTVTVNVRGLESALAANAGAGVLIEQCNSAGTVISAIVADTTVPATITEYGTADTAKNGTYTPTSTALGVGDRIKVTLKARDAGGTMASGRTVTNSVDGPTGGAAGDTWVSFTEAITEQSTLGATASSTSSGSASTTALLALAASAGQAVAGGWNRLQSAGGTSASGVASFGVAFATANLTAGTKLIAAVSCSAGGGGTVASVKDGAGNSFTEIAHAQSGAVAEASLWAIDTPAGDVGTKPTITATITAGTGTFSMVIQEVAGLAAGSTLAAMVDGTPGTATGSNNTGVGSSPTYSDTVANEYLVAVYGDDGGPLTWTKPTGLTADTASVNANANTDCVLAYGNSTGGAETTTWSLTGTATPWATLAAAFKLAAGAGGWASSGQATAGPAPAAVAASASTGSAGSAGLALAPAAASAPGGNASTGQATLTFAGVPTTWPVAASGANSSSAQGTVTEAPARLAAAASSTSSASADVAIPSATQPVGSPPGGPWVLVLEDHFTTAYTGFPGQGAPSPALWADHYIDGDTMRSNDNGAELGWAPHNKAGLAIDTTGTGVLKLIARHEDPRNSASAGYDPACPATNPAGNAPSYTDAIIQSKPGFSQTYGYWEARIAWPLTDGEWPAFWLVGSDQVWPPEFDICEQFDSSNAYSTTYFPEGGGSSGQSNTTGFTGSLSSFHVYGMRWDATTIKFYIDGNLVFTAAGTITAIPQVVIFDFEVRSNTTGVWPATAQVDYVRVWTKSGVPAQPVISSITPADGKPTAGTLNVKFADVGATSYRATVCPVDARADGSPASRLTATGAWSSGGLTVSGLTNGARYCVTVCGTNVTGYSTESLPVPALFTPPAAVTAGGGNTSSGTAATAAALAASASASTASAGQAGPVWAPARAGATAATASTASAGVTLTPAALSAAASSASSAQATAAAAAGVAGAAVAASAGSAAFAPAVLTAGAASGSAGQAGAVLAAVLAATAATASGGAASVVISGSATTWPVAAAGQVTSAGTAATTGVLATSAAGLNIPAASAFTPLAPASLTATGTAASTASSNLAAAGQLPVTATAAAASAGQAGPVLAPAALAATAASIPGGQAAFTPATLAATATAVSAGAMAAGILRVVTATAASTSGGNGQVVLSAGLAATAVAASAAAAVMVARAALAAQAVGVSMGLAVFRGSLSLTATAVSGPGGNAVVTIIPLHPLGPTYASQPHGYWNALEPAVSSWSAGPPHTRFSAGQ